MFEPDHDEGGVLYSETHVGYRGDPLHPEAGHYKVALVKGAWAVPARCGSPS